MYCLQNVLFVGPPNVLFVGPPNVLFVGPQNVLFASASVHLSARKFDWLRQ